MNQVSVAVLVERNAVARFSRIVKASERLGMRIDHQNKEIGIFSGVIDEAHVADIAKIKGVQLVERQRQVEVS